MAEKNDPACHYPSGRVPPANTIALEAISNTSNNGSQADSAHHSTCNSSDLVLGSLGDKRITGRELSREKGGSTADVNPPKQDEESLPGRKRRRQNKDNTGEIILTQAIPSHKSDIYETEKFHRRIIGYLQTWKPKKKRVQDLAPDESQYTDSTPPPFGSTRPPNPLTPSEDGSDPLLTPVLSTSLVKSGASVVTVPANDRGDQKPLGRPQEVPSETSTAKLSSGSTSFWDYHIYHQHYANAATYLTIIGASVAAAGITYPAEQSRLSWELSALKEWNYASLANPAETTEHTPR